MIYILFQSKKKSFCCNIGFLSCIIIFLFFLFLFSFCLKNIVLLEKNKDFLDECCSGFGKSDSYYDQRKLEFLVNKIANLQSKLYLINHKQQSLIKKYNLRGLFTERVNVDANQASIFMSKNPYNFDLSELIEKTNTLLYDFDISDNNHIFIESFLDSSQARKDFFVNGKPVIKGIYSSGYGNRVDPFSGKIKMHKGVDFAGKKGSYIIATASGVVCWSGYKHGYGKVVILEHALGYSTRYAHNDFIFVNLGDFVSKGQKIASMGSSGRSTGPHVHYEVWRDNKRLNPDLYINRSIE